MVLFRSALCLPFVEHLAVLKFVPLDTHDVALRRDVTVERVGQGCNIMYNLLFAVVYACLAEWMQQLLEARRSFLFGSVFTWQRLWGGELDPFCECLFFPAYVQWLCVTAFALFECSSCDSVFG